jgi:hypothetical protein
METKMIENLKLLLNTWMFENMPGTFTLNECEECALAFIVKFQEVLAKKKPDEK